MGKKRSFKAKTTELINRMRRELLSLALKGVGSVLSSFASESLACEGEATLPMAGEGKKITTNKSRNICSTLQLR